MRLFGTPRLCASMHRLTCKLCMLSNIMCRGSKLSARGCMKAKQFSPLTPPPPPPPTPHLRDWMISEQLRTEAPYIPCSPNICRRCSLGEIQERAPGTLCTMLDTDITKRKTMATIERTAWQVAT